MPHMDVSQFLGTLALMLAAAKLAGLGLQRIGQPAVLGELLAGVLLGSSVLGVVDAKADVWHMLGELGVVLLLFEIGLETNLHKLLQVGGASAAVAVVGVVLPFALGYGVCRAVGLDNMVAVVAGAALTATSVGITARVLSDLGRLQDPESQIVLGAAVIDDVVGLVILTVVEQISEGNEVSPLSVLGIVAVAMGFVLVAVVVGGWVIPPAFEWLRRKLPDTVPLLALLLALSMAWLADMCGSALIIGAFAGGLVLARTSFVKEIEHGIAPLGKVFVPLFFVVVGAQVDVGVLNPFDAANGQTLEVGGLLIVVAVATKFVAGYAPFWFEGKKSVIGVGMVPRGEVGLIFAQKGKAHRVFDDGMFSAVTLMVMVTTFVAPPLLRWLLGKGPAPEKLPE